MFGIKIVVDKLHIIAFGTKYKNIWQHVTDFFLLCAMPQICDRNLVFIEICYHKIKLKKGLTFSKMVWAL